MKTLNAGANELFKSGEIRLKRKILEADMINDVKGKGNYLNMLDDQKEHEERLGQQLQFFCTTTRQAELESKRR